MQSTCTVYITSCVVVAADPPTITSAPTADRVVKGYNATLRCHANGNPVVHYEWFRASIPDCTNQFTGR